MESTIENNSESQNKINEDDSVDGKVNHSIENQTENAIENNEADDQIENIIGNDEAEDRTENIIEGIKADDQTENVTENNEGTTAAPNLLVLHEDVRERIETHLHQQGYTDVNINVEIGSNLGDNFMGFIGKLTVTGVDTNQENKTFNWIVKAAPSLKAYRDIANITVAYEREAHLYEDIFKIFRGFQIEKQILEPFDQHPEFILSYLEDMKESIVMKDMKSIGYVMTPREKPLDLNHVKLVMKAYAKLHAMSYALQDQKPDVFNKLVETTRDITSDTVLQESIVKVQAPMFDHSRSVLDPIKDAKIQSVYIKFLDNYPDIITKLLKDTNERSVIGHGDSWVNNMLWKYDVEGSNIPNKVCLLDWQLSRYGSPACDLSYFIFTCTTKEFRDKHFDNMIKLYYYTLCSHIVDLGSNPENILSFDELQEELKKYSLIGLFTTILVLYIITKDSSEIPEWRSDDVDQEEVQEEWTKLGRNADKYNERTRGVIVDYYEKGYFDNLMTMGYL